MTCFRFADTGETVRSKCRTEAEYQRFCRAMEKGATVEEAFNSRKVAIYKSGHRSPLLRKLEEVLEYYDMNTYFRLYSYMYRNKCSLDDAIKWAARSGRVVLKTRKRKEYLKIC